MPLKDSGDDVTLAFISEINLMAKIEFHPNVIQFIGQVTAKQPLILVLEYCENGSLLDYLRKVRAIVVKLS